MKNNIHQTPEEELAENTAASVHAISETGRKIAETTKAIKDLHTTAKDKSIETTGFTGLLKGNKVTNETLAEIKAQSPKVIQKLEEVKSANLISNKLLKEIRDKEAPEPKEFPKEMEVSLKGISVLTLKGDQGDKGDDGDTPTKEEIVSLIKPLIPAPIKGEDGKTPSKKELVAIIKPLIPAPIKGDKGDSVKGDKGDDGSPDLPDEIIAKINNAEAKIDSRQVKGLIQALRFVEEFGTNPVGGAGGGPTYAFRLNGTKVSDHVTELNFTTNMTATYAGNGRINISSTGGGGATTFYSETPTGVIDGANLSYTVANTITTVVNFAINGQYIHPVEYSVAGTTITFVAALPAQLSGTSFTIVYV